MSGGPGLEQGRRSADLDAHTVSAVDPFRAGKLVGNAVVGLLGAGLLLAAGLMAASIVSRADVPVEAISGATVSVAIGAASVVAVGVTALAITKTRDIMLLAALTTTLTLLTIVGLFSAGVLVLPLALGALYLLIRRCSGRRGFWPSLFAGSGVAVGLAVLWITWIQQPLVECGSGGAITRSRPWWDNNGSSSGQSASRRVGGNLVTSGWIDTPAGRYVFLCTDGELTQFRRSGDN